MNLQQLLAYLLSEHPKNLTPYDILENYLKPGNEIDQATEFNPNWNIHDQVLYHLFHAAADMD